MACVFCSIVAEEAPAFRVYEDMASVAVLDIAPATPGHTLVLPREHTPDLLDASAEVAGSVMQAAQAVARLLDDRLHPDGFSIIQSNRAAAWQEVFHLHVHVIPRYRGDGLVPPWRGSSPTEQELATVHASIRGA